MRRASTAMSMLCIVLILVAPADPVAEAAVRQGNQGLQGGWSIDDGGRVNFLHAASQQFPIMRDAGAGWVRVHFRLGACFAMWGPQAPACGTADGATALEVDAADHAFPSSLAQAPATRRPTRGVAGTAAVTRAGGRRGRRLVGRAWWRGRRRRGRGWRRRPSVRGARAR